MPRHLPAFSSTPDNHSDFACLRRALPQHIADAARPAAVLTASSPIICLLFITRYTRACIAPQHMAPSCALSAARTTLHRYDELFYNMLPRLRGSRLRGLLTALWLPVRLIGLRLPSVGRRDLCKPSGSAPSSLGPAIFARAKPVLATA